MAWRSIWACGSVIVSTIRPRIIKQLSQWGLQTKSLNDSCKISRVLLYQASKSNDQTFPTTSTLKRLNIGAANNVVGSKTSSCHGIRSYSSDYDDDRRRHRIPLKLMVFTEILWPNLIKSFKNKFFAILISGYYDKTFSVDTFIEGCTQAVSLVSSCISEGNFDSLQGLVEEEAIQEIRNSYADLNVSQRRFIHVNPRDIFYRFVYEIGMMFDDETDQRFVEVTVVLQGFHGYHEATKEPEDYYKEIRDNKESFYVCNYRFIREFTKGVEGDWSINKLNHFSPREGAIKY